ncbi:tetraprenyl-beta-curcumene synthase family protein [Paenibacillus sp. y28]|uniref:tetraprenyl-beta-curcumene synthase family protein n=1 Tax=Paenibacillus sp. y28 TaxID=3129110 RepID=UPI003016D134
MYRLYKSVLPEVARQLDDIRTHAERMPDPELRTQAIASMTSKRFHCQGGSVYAAAHMPMSGVLVPLIVAFQTISDYLDNLCDRSTSLDPEDFRLLHQSMLDAVNPHAGPTNYYAKRQEQEDGGYLAGLVRTCQTCLLQLPSYAAVQDHVRELVGLYCDLQVYKHIRHDLREGELFRWWGLHQAQYPDLRWNEFAAATGSTLGVFYLFLAASRPGLNEAEAVRIKRAYFPYVCGLHILLDYLIDMEEDRIGGDLNFCSYYSGEQETAERIIGIVRKARREAEALEDSPFHRMIIEGLLAVYLSDPKVKPQRGVQAISQALMRGSPMTRIFFWLNTMLVRSRKL